MRICSGVRGVKKANGCKGVFEFVYFSPQIRFREGNTQILSSSDLIDKPVMQHSELKYMRYKAVQHFCSSEVDLHADMLRKASHRAVHAEVKK